MNPLKFLISPAYRADLKAKRAEQARIREKQERLTDLALAYADVIPRALREMGVYRRYVNKQTGEEKEVLVRVDEIKITADYFIFHVAHPYPIGVNRNDLEKHLDHVEDRLGIPTTAKYQVGAGFRYFVERRGKVGGMPAVVKYSQIMKRVPPETSKDGLVTFPVGIGRDNKVYFNHLVDVAHYGIFGATGYGKSNSLAATLCALSETYSPRDLEMVFIDLKGTDLFLLEDLPQVGIRNSVTDAPEGTDKSIDDFELAMEVLRWMMRESKARNETRIRPSNSRNLRGYNQKNRAASLPNVMVVIDELSLLMLDSTHRKEASELLSKIAATVRSSGLHLVPCTQLPNRDVLPSLINANIPSRVSFYTTTGVASGISLGDGTYDAHTEINGHRGRALFIGGPYTKEMCQTPLITDRDIKAAKERAQAKWAKTHHDVTAQEILEWVFAHNNRRYEWKRIYEYFSPQGITQDEIKKIGRQYQVRHKDGEWMPQFEIEGENHILAPAVDGPEGYARTITPLAEWLRLQGETESEPEPKNEVRAIDVFSYAIKNHDGRFNRRELYPIFNEKGVSVQNLKDWGKEYEGEIISIEGQPYRLLPGGPGYPRQFEALGHGTRDGIANQNPENGDTAQPEQRPIAKSDALPEPTPVLEGEIVEEEEPQPTDQTRRVLTSK